MNKQYDDLCDQLDAAVFTGELVSDPANRDGFKDYLARWNRELGSTTAHDRLAEKRTGMRISASGILGRIRDGRYFKELNVGCSFTIWTMSAKKQRASSDAARHPV